MNRLIAFAAAISLVAGFSRAGEPVVYTVGDAAFEGWFAAAIGTPRGTVVVLPTWKGVSDYERDRAEMLAGQGWNAFVGDLHGAGKLPLSKKEMAAAHDAFFAEPERMRSVLQGAVVTAERLGGPDVVVMGYSMGGGAAMELARSGLGNDLGVDGYAVFSGRVSDPAGRMVPDGTAPIFVVHGEHDSRLPVSALVNFADDMDFTDVRTEVHVYPGAGHLFSAFGFPNYDAGADRDSWAKLGLFLDSVMP